MGLISGIVKGVGGAIGAASTKRAARRAAQRNEAILKGQEQRSQDWYDREYNADFTQRSDAQAAINKARDVMNEHYKSAQGAAAVGGATDESVAQQKAAANRVLSDTTSNIAERADAYKEQVRANYEAQQDNIDAQRMGINNQRAQATAQAAQGFVSAAEGLGEAADTLWGGKLTKLFSK